VDEFEDFRGFMPVALQRLMFAVAASLVTIALAWGWIGHFHVDAAAYIRPALIGLVMLAAGIFYQVRRPDPKIVAMLLGASFLILFSAAANLLNNFLLTVAGPRIDAQLDAADRALGFDWYRLMLRMADHPVLNGWLFQIYNVALPEIALMVVVLAWSGKVDKTYRFCLAVAFGAVICISVWAFMPSFGAMSLYTLPQDVAHRLKVALTCEFGKAQVAMLRDGPGYITLNPLHGSLIGFPSYHGVLALLVVWYARSFPRLFWPLLAINALILVSTPMQGGHHLVDVLASFPVTAMSIFLVARLEKACKWLLPVNKSSAPAESLPAAAE
jgi:hypothetical protein